MTEEEIRAALGASPLLTGVDPSALLFLARLGRYREFRPGQILMRQGEPSASIQFILSGHVRAERARRSDARPFTLAELDAGEAVGEMGVLNDIPRTATVVALGPTSTLELDAATFEKIARAYPLLHLVLMRLLSQRLRATASAAGSEDAQRGER